MFFGVVSLPLRQLYDCINGSELIQKGMDKIDQYNNFDSV